MVHLYYDDIKYAVWLDGREITSSPLTVMENSVTTAVIMSIDCPNIIPSVCRISIDSAGVISGSLNFVRLDKGCYYMYPLLTRVTAKKELSVLRQQSFGQHLLTSYDDGEMHLLIENSTHYYGCVLHSTIDKIESIETAEGLLFVTMCKRELVIVLYDHHDYVPILQQEFDSCEFTAEGIFLTKALRDNQGRILHCGYVYSMGAYERTDTYFEYDNSHSLSDNLLAYDLIDAIIACDDSYARDILAPDLSPVTVRDFFGDNISLVTDIPLSDTLLLSAPDGSLHSYTFCHSKGIITDIIEND